MFSETMPPKTAKPKPPPPKPHGNQVAEVCGVIAGMPQSFASALESLGEIIRRCKLCEATTGILTPKHAERIRMIRADLSDDMATISELRKEVDAMITAGVAMPQKQPTEDLF